MLERLHAGLRSACRATLVQALVLSAFRVAFLLRHAGPNAHFPAADLAGALVMGARFDLKVSACAALPLIVLGAAWPTRRGRWVAAGWAGATAFALAVLAMVNDGYFGFFHTPLDLQVFGLFEDDTRAVFQALWEEHRVVVGPLAALALAALQTRVALRPLEARPSRRAALALAAVAPVLFPVAIRGRLDRAPLAQRDFAVTSNAFLNAAVPNGAIALLVAVSERRAVRIGDDPYASFAHTGFSRPADAAAALGLAPPGAPDAAVAEALFTRTPENPYAAAHPPHVVLVVMESWGADLLRYHSPGNDLLGRLAPHLARGLVFRRFVSGANWTSASLEALLVNSPIAPLLNGDPGLVPFEQSSVLPFRKAGYRTAFAMGWSSTWRAIGRSFPHQGFDEVDDVSTITAAFPDAPLGVWGVPDAVLFGWALERLRQADRAGEHLLLVLMTSTNHAPFRTPEGYVPGPLDPTALAGRKVAPGTDLRPRLETYQYACDALGGFLTALEAQDFSGRTIVAATGDHNAREIFSYSSTDDLPWRERVPLFLRIPPAYLAGRPAPDLERWAGHRDVFPTLAGLALSGARVFRSGDDLLSSPSRPPRALAQFQTVLSDAGVKPSLDEPGVVCWSPGGGLSSEASAPCRPAVEAVAREELALRVLLDWDVRRQAIAAGARRRERAVAAAIAR